MLVLHHWTKEKYNKKAPFNGFRSTITKISLLVKTKPHRNSKEFWELFLIFITIEWGGGGATLSPPTSEAGVRFPARPQVGKLVVASHWSAVYSTEP